METFVCYVIILVSCLYMLLTIQDVVYSAGVTVFRAGQFLTFVIAFCDKKREEVRVGKVKKYHRD